MWQCMEPIGEPDRPVVIQLIAERFRDPRDRSGTLRVALALMAGGQQNQPVVQENQEYQA